MRLRIKRILGRWCYGIIARTLDKRERGWYNYSWKFDGHIITVKKVNGKIVLYAPQNNHKFTSLQDISSYLRRTEKHALMDFTDVKLDEKFCDKIMKRR